MPGLPVAKPYLFNSTLKKQKESIATLPQVAPDNPSPNDRKKKVALERASCLGIIVCAPERADMMERASFLCSFQYIRENHGCLKRQVQKASNSCT